MAKPILSRYRYFVGNLGSNKIELDGGCTAITVSSWKKLNQVTLGLYGGYKSAIVVLGLVTADCSNSLQKMHGIIDSDLRKKVNYVIL